MDTGRLRPLLDVRYALLFAAPALMLLVQLVATQRADPDLWGRISVGAVLSRTGRLPIADDFSYTASGARWIDHEWLTGVVFFAVLEWAGEPGLMLLKYALAACALALVFVAHRVAYGASPLWAGYGLVVLGPGFLSAFLATLRAQVFSIAFFLLFLLVLERVRLDQWRPRALLGLVAAGVVWANLHGGFAMGLLALGLYGLAEAFHGRFARAAQHLVLALALFALVGAINPYGLDYLGFLVHAWTLDRTGVTEWQPLLAGPWGPGKLYIALVALVALGLGIFGVVRAVAARWAVGRSGADADEQGVAARAPDRLAPALVLLLVLVMTLEARRIHSFLSLTLAFYLPLLAAGLGGLGGIGRLGAIGRVGRLREGRPRRWAELYAPALLCGTALFLLWTGLPGRPILRTQVPAEHAIGTDARYRYPVGAVRFLRASPYEGRLLAPFTFGEFLYWCLYPRFRVAIDGRFEEVYERSQFVWIRIFYGGALEGRPERAVSMAHESGADFILLRAGQAVLAPLRGSRAWRVVYRDGVFVLLGRAATLDRYPPLPQLRSEAPASPSIGDYFTPHDLQRFAGYPVAQPSRPPPGSTPP